MQVEASVYELERHVPSLLKRATCQAITVAQKAPELALAVASEVHRAGVVDTAKNITKSMYNKCEPTAKELCTKYEPVAKQYALWAWRSLNRVPLVPQVAQVLVPTAAYWSEKYNQGVRYSADRGFTVAMYLPLIPTERIAKVFQEANPHPAVEAHGKSIALSQ